MYKDLSPYLLRNSFNVQIPLAKKNILFNSFFWKAASLWNALPIFIKSSASFSSFKSRLETFYCGSKHNCWHLHGSNPRNTSLRCRLRLGHSVLNLKKRTYRMCLCGNKEKEEHLLLNCSLTPCFELTWRNLWNQFYWKVCKIYCQVYYMIIQACCNFYYLHILRWNLNPQPICITLSLNILN